MEKRLIPRILAALAAALAVYVLAPFVLGDAASQTMPNTIRFDLGQDINATAKASGLPEFNRSKTATTTDYESPVPVPGAQTAALYTRPGYEIRSPSPLFALRLTADSALADPTAVQSVSIQIDSTAFPTHERARQLVQNLIQQFSKGKWQRYIPAECPRLTGASSLIDPKQVSALTKDAPHEARFDCPLDPGWVLDARTWEALMGQTQRYTWIGDGVVATLEISYAHYGSDDTPDYTVFLRFQTQNSMQTYADTRARMDAEKRGATDTALDKAEREHVQKLLEDEAVKRGEPLAR